MSYYRLKRHPPLGAVNPLARKLKSDNPLAGPSPLPGQSSTQPGAAPGGVGLLLRVTEAGKLVVSDFAPGSPVREAGVRPGDVLVSVDGKQVDPDLPDLSIAQIRGPVGSTVRLRFARGDTTGGRKIEVTLKRVRLRVPLTGGSLPPAGSNPVPPSDRPEATPAPQSPLPGTPQMGGGSPGMPNQRFNQNWEPMERQP